MNLSEITDKRGVRYENNGITSNSSDKATRIIIVVFQITGSLAPDKVRSFRAYP
jgi:hypothetical protein